MKTVSDLRAVPHIRGQRIDLTWRNPPAQGFAGGPPLAGVQVVRRERSFPEAPDDGRTVYDGPAIERFSDLGLDPLTAYYYAVFTFTIGPKTTYADSGSRVACLATADYGLTERLYRMLPAAHQKYDVLSAAERAQLGPAVLEALAALPPALRDRGPLRRFFEAAMPFDLMRSLAEGLRLIRDVDRALPDFLEPMARAIGWEPDRGLTVNGRREEIRAAPRLYRGVGTIPNLRAIVQRTTGWDVQVSEFVQSIALANAPRIGNLFALRETTEGWIGTDDAAPVLEFVGPSAQAGGTASLPAILVSGPSEPFRIVSGQTITIRTNDGPAVTTRFLTGDFMDHLQAGAAELAEVLNRTHQGIRANARADGRLVLQTQTPGSGSSLRIEPREPCLVSLESAPRGRLSITMDDTGRARLFYTRIDPLISARLAAIATQRGQIRGKTLRAETWSDSTALPASRPGAIQGDPAAVTLPDGRTWIAWLEDPETEHAAIVFAAGTPRAPTPPRLEGRRSGPFAVRPGSLLVIRHNDVMIRGVEFSAADFASPGQATAAEVVAAFNARLNLPGVAAFVGPGESIMIESATPGGDERLTIEPRRSSAANTLGFDEANAHTTGDWGDAIDWQPAITTPAPAPPGRHADLFALEDSSGVRLFWSTHSGNAWRLVTSRWNGAAWSALDILADGPQTLAEVQANRPIAHREPCAVRDASGRTWLFWAGGWGLGTAGETWTLRRRVFDPATNTWNAEIELIAPPAGAARVADREPGTILLPDGRLRVFFRSDRAGGQDVWSVHVDPATNAVTAPVMETSGPASSFAPSPLAFPDGTLWLLFRSDRSVPLGTIAARSLPAPFERGPMSAPDRDQADRALRHSRRIEDPGTIRRHAGSLSVVPGDLTRNHQRRLFDELLCYTPQKPLAPLSGETIAEDDLYTRGTIGLHVIPRRSDQALTRPMVDRLLQTLHRFLPANARAVVIFRPSVLVENAGAGLKDAFLDVYPYLEPYASPGGAPRDSTIVALPEWEFLRANLPGHVSADPADLTTLRRKSYYPPPS